MVRTGMIEIVCRRVRIWSNGFVEAAKMVEGDASIYSFFHAVRAWQGVSARRFPTILHTCPDASKLLSVRLLHCALAAGR